MGYKQSLPSLNSGECNERNELRYKGFKWMGMNLMPMMDEEKGGGSRASGVSTQSDIGLNITR